jgi:hypothetical protein
MRFLSCLAFLAVTLSLGACASLTTGTAKMTLVEAHDGKGNNVPGAACVLKNEAGEWRVKTPGQASIAGAFENLLVRCDADDFPPGQASVASTAKAQFVGNLLLGGPVGMLIDHASGAAYEYPSLIRVKLGDSVVIQPAYNGGGVSTKPHADPMKLPPRTDWAAIDDVSRLPLKAKGQESYRKFLKARYPRALAIGPKGEFSWASNDPQAAGAVLEKCGASAKAACALYAVDDYVVWSDAIAKKLGIKTAGQAAASIQKAAVGVGHNNPQALPKRTGWASLDDLQMLPVHSERGRAAYRRWLAQPAPRVFTVGPGGVWAASSGRGDAVEHALKRCEADGRMTCRVYAIDDDVVWSDTAAAEIQAATWLPLTSEAPASTPSGPLDDVGAVPFLSAGGRKGYADFLQQRTPRAFAISNSGAFGWSAGRDDAPERALQYCQKSSRSPCLLYALDQRVVWPQGAPDN